MKEYILITGASSGIGSEMARLLAEKRLNLILVARNEEKLLELQKELTSKHEIEVLYVIKDLSVVSAAEDLYMKIQECDLLVTALVNNAGVGNYGRFTHTSLEEELQMIQLNISSLITLTKLFGKDMVRRRSGRIMNVASLLAFLPFPYYSVYSATKTFVLAFTETLAAELENSGVVVTALCPGPVDTGFTTSEMINTKAYQFNKPVHPTIVAQQGVQLLLNGKGTKIVGFQNGLLANLSRFMPGKLMMKIKKILASQA